MKLTSQQLKQIIKEELQKTLKEHIPPGYVKAPQKQAPSGQQNQTQYLGWQFVAAGVWSKTACPKCSYGIRQNGNPVKYKPGKGNEAIPVKINRAQGNQIIKAMRAMESNKDPNFQRCRRIFGAIDNPAQWKECVQTPNWLAPTQKQASPQKKQTGGGCMQECMAFKGGEPMYMRLIGDVGTPKRDAACKKICKASTRYAGIK